jgi:ABC-type polysaccharide/polyol phosphate transport system ATPase subunit
MIADQPAQIIEVPAQARPPATGEVAISVRGLSKMYRIYDRPQDRLKHMLWRGRRRYGREFWALRDVSFDVYKGETVGIIGRNGSGKSTLLQIIAGTLAATEGEVWASGRVAALLELGSGFNPEFTGRENVFLNGTILGIGHQEMERRFDEIAAFADIGDFIDQPIKIYSSGMLVRLAFAVQAHIEPDVLIVDEALSVGDVYFQHKCMRRIKQLVDRGTTLLFVSHTAETVKRFCQRGLWLDGGQARYYGEAGVATEKYLAFMRMREIQDWLPNSTDQEDANVSTSAEINGVPLEQNIIPGAQNHVTTLESPQLLEQAGGTNGATRMIDLEHLLVPFVSEVDLAEEHLFLKGQWDWATSPEERLPIRYSSDPAALAGFRCSGNRIELDFLQGVSGGMTRVELDGVERLLDLFHPTEQRIVKFHLEVSSGEHTVLISSAEQFGWRGRGIWWAGGRISVAAHLAFHRDPQIGLGDDKVERYGTGKARLTAVELLDYVSEQEITELTYGQRVRLRLHAERLAPAGPRLEFSYIVRDRNRIDLFGTTTIDEYIRLDPAAERFVVEFAFDVRLGPGSYSILASFVECSEDLSRRVPMDQIDIAKVFTVAFDPSRPVWYMFYEPVVVSATVYSCQEDDG